MTNLDVVVKELQEERERLDHAIGILTSLAGTGRPKPTSRTQRQKRHISAAGIRRIRAAAKARWAKVKAKQQKNK